MNLAVNSWLRRQGAAGPVDRDLQGSWDNGCLRRRRPAPGFEPVPSTSWGIPDRSIMAPRRGRRLDGTAYHLFNRPKRGWDPIASTTVLAGPTSLRGSLPIRIHP